MLDITYFDEETLAKVYQAIGKAQPSIGSLTMFEAAREIVNELQNAGILFRERVPTEKAVELGAVASIPIRHIWNTPF